MVGDKMFVFNLWLKFCSDDTSMANNESLFDILEVYLVGFWIVIQNWMQTPFVFI